jgi:hypothetical protein
MIKIKVKKSTAPRFYIDFKNDPFYLEGFERGYKEGLEISATESVEKLLFEGCYSIQFIAEIIGRPEDFVLSIQSRLIQEGKLLPRFEAFST